MPTVQRPSIATTTVPPAKSTERPAVATAVTSALSTLISRASPCRKRVTISSE